MTTESVSTRTCCGSGAGATTTTSGGVTGKMISPQSIAIACAAVGLAGKESDLFRFTVKHSLAFLVLIGTTLIAEGFGAHVPKGYIYAAMAFSALHGLNE